MTLLTGGTLRQEPGGADPAALQKAANLADLPDKPASRGNMGLDTAATQPVEAFDAAGDAADQSAAAAAAALATAQAYSDTHGARRLAPVAVQAAPGPYAAADGQLVPCDASTGSFFVNLPDTPANGTTIGVLLATTAAGGTVTIAAAGADVIDRAGTTQLVLQLQSTLKVLTYQSGTWYTAGGNLSLSQLDSRWVPAIPAGATIGDVLTVRGDGSYGPQVPTDLSSAVDTALSTAGVLNASQAPTLATNLVPDPQIKTSGGVPSPASFALTRIVAGLPPGFAYGIQSTRQGAMSTVVGQLSAGSPVATNPLKIVAVAGQTYTVGQQIWTDRAAASARLDVLWYDAAGTFLSTTAGVYTPIVQNTWEQRSVVVVAPVNAAIAVPQCSVTTTPTVTVAGALVRATGTFVYAGNVAAPTYADGGSIGWAWTGAAHASLPKKVLFGPNDVESPTGSAAKVAAHNADGASHAGLVRTASVPTLATNELLDPRLTNGATWSKTTGATFPGVGVTLADLNADGTEFVYPGIDKVCAPGESITASAAFQLLAGAATFRVRVRWLNAAFGTISDTSITGAITGVATRQTVTAVAPAGTAFVRAIFYAETMTGTSQVKITQAMLNRQGATDYIDGTVVGCAWTGAADASTSIRLFASAATTTALAGLPARVTTLEGTVAGALTVTRAGTLVTIAKAFNGPHTLTISTDLRGSQNGAFNFTNTALDGVSVVADTDDVTPIRTQLGTIGANHGYSVVATFANPDGKTAADLGSVYQDTAGRQYVLLAFTTDAVPLLVMGGDYTVDGAGVVSSANVAPVTDLTHVSGGAHFGAIDHTTQVASQLHPSIGRITVTAWADGKPMTADGVLTCRELVIRESYAILDYAAIYNAAAASVGVSYTTQADTLAGAVRVSNVFRFTAGAVRVTTSLTELKPTALGQCGSVQAAIMGEAGATITRYLPGVGIVSGFDWTAGVNMTGYATSVVVVNANLTNANRPPALSLDVLSLAGAPVIGFAMGYLPYGARGDELSTSAARLVHAGTKLWDLRDTQKNYPTWTTGEAAGWGHIATEAFRAYMDPTQIAAVLASKADAAATFDALAANVNLQP